MDERKTTTSNRCMVLVCALLMAWTPVWSAPPPAAIGRVTGGGPVRLNGIAAPTGTNVFAGNRINTGSEAPGYVSLTQGGRLVLGRSTTAEISQDGDGVTVRLDRGVLGVVSAAKLPVIVSAGGVTVRAERDDGVYEVSLEGKELKVLASHGSATATGANRSVEVPQGKVMNATVKGSSLSGKGQVVLAGLVFAGVAGIGLGVALSNQTRHCISTGELNCQ